MLVFDALSKLMIFEVMGVLLRILCRADCSHDTLTAIKGISPQYYDFQKQLDDVPYYRMTQGDHETIPMSRSGLNNSVKSSILLDQESIQRTTLYTDGLKHTNAINTSTEYSNERLIELMRLKAAIFKTTSVINETTGRHSTTEEKVSNEIYHHLFKPIRIKVFVQERYLSFNMSSTWFKRLNDSIHHAVKEVQNILSVIPVRGRLRFNRTPDKICSSFWSSNTITTRMRNRRCSRADSSYDGEECVNGFIIPDDHLRGYPIFTKNTRFPSYWLYRNGQGIADTDMLMYVNAKNTVFCEQNGLIAYASYCHLDQYSRPISGFINYCPSYLKSDSFSGKMTYLTSLHELFHVLGFSKDLFDKFQDCELTVHSSKVSRKTYIKYACERRKTAINFNGRFNSMSTPSVKMESRKHWNCVTVEGCPLENHFKEQDGASSHWEKRFMQGSLMTPTIGPPHLTVLDKVTLAAFKDMGWYLVNMSLGEELLWGKGAGCDFMSESFCINSSSPFFCMDRNSRGCNFLHLDKGICQTDQYLDGCNIYKSKPGQECWKSGNREKSKGNNGEYYSEDSRCFISSLTHYNSTVVQDTDIDTTNYEGRCYLHRCNDSSTLEIKAQGSEWKLCQENIYVSFTGYNGNVLCPHPHSICRIEKDLIPVSLSDDVSVMHCGNFTILMRGISCQIEYQSEDSIKCDVMVTKIIEAIVESTGIHKDCFHDVRFVNSNAIYFALRLSSTPDKKLAKEESYQKSSFSPGTNLSELEGKCSEIAKSLLLSLTNETFKLIINGTRYTILKIDFKSSFDELDGIGELFHDPVPMYKTNAGIHAAALIGSACITAFFMIGMAVYRKTTINVSVAPLPATPVGANVRYQNSGKRAQKSPESGSAGQLPSAEFP